MGAKRRTEPGFTACVCCGTEFHPALPHGAASFELGVCIPCRDDETIANQLGSLEDQIGAAEQEHEEKMSKLRDRWDELEKARIRVDDWKDGLGG